MDEKINSLWDVSDKKRYKYFLGPMIRASSLPLRLTSLYYNPNINVYSEEIPSNRLSNSKLCKRIDNHILNTIDFIEKKDSNDQKSIVLFRTHKHLEKNKNNCILQLSASNAITVLKAAQAVEKDVAAIDINMGCPKFYSVSRDMGSALMKNPELAEDIIKTLRRNINIPISVKTRLQSVEDDTNTINSNINDTSINLLPKQVDIKKSNEWLLQLQACGANAITIHMRTPSEKTCHHSHTEIFPILYHSIQSNLNTPLVYNGDIWSINDVNYIYKSLNIDSSTYNNQSKKLFIMVSRGGLWDPSIFQRLDELHMNDEITHNHNYPSNVNSNNNIVNSKLIKSDVITQILKFSAISANCIYNTRYLLQQILASSKTLNTIPILREIILKSYSLSALINNFNNYDSILFGNAYDFVINEKLRQSNIIHNKSFEDKNLSDKVNMNSYNNDYDTNNDNNVININNSNEFKYNTDYDTNNNIIDYSEYYNCKNWPGIVNITSHTYDDSYFDTNYYTAFHKCHIQYKDLNTTTTNSYLNNNMSSDIKNIEHLESEKRNTFTYSGFNDSVSTIVRINKKIKY